MSLIGDDDMWPSSVLLRFDDPFGSVVLGGGYTFASVAAWLI